MYIYMCMCMYVYVCLYCSDEARWLGWVYLLIYSLATKKEGNLPF